MIIVLHTYEEKRWLVLVHWLILLENHQQNLSWRLNEKYSRTTNSWRKYRLDIEIVMIISIFSLKWLTWTFWRYFDSSKCSILFEKLWNCDDSIIMILNLETTNFYIDLDSNCSIRILESQCLGDLPKKTRTCVLRNRKSAIDLALKTISSLWAIG